MFRFFASLFSKPVSNKAAARSRLIAMLSDPAFEFRKLDTLVKYSGLDRSDTIDMLYEIGARPAFDNFSLFGLKSVVGERPRRR